MNDGLFKLLIKRLPNTGTIDCKKSKQRQKSSINPNLYRVMHRFTSKKAKKLKNYLLLFLLFWLEIAREKHFLANNFFLILKSHLGLFGKQAFPAAYDNSLQTYELHL